MKSYRDSIEQKNYISREQCPVCGSKDSKVVINYPLNSDRILPFLESYYENRVPLDKIDFDYCIVKCDICSLLFQKHILNDENMFLLYEKWISKDESLNKKKFADIFLFINYALEVSAIASMLKRKPQDIKVLEFGMGWGFWANIARAFNFQVTGAEISEERIRYAESNGLKVTRDIDDEEAESYDYIYANQVFEHIEEPAETLKKLSRTLKKKGIIHIKVPFGYNIEKKLKKRHWKAGKDALHPLEHINYYKRKTLKVLAKQVGLSVINRYHYPKKLGYRFFLSVNLRYICSLFKPTNIYLTKDL